ncbi:MAG: DbpA RNA binding domain-containing protein [Treponemataceae bacterium]|nr:DbpA RNA binding domain-containing protein [Treponemataceae bacterium]
MPKKNLPVDADQLAALFRDAVQKVQMDEDPLELNEYRKIFKKNVPLHLRSYVAGYIATKLCNPSKGNFSQNNWKKNKSEKNSRHERNSYSHDSQKETSVSEDVQEPKAKTPRVEIPEADAATIFVGIGRNRHVYPKDLVGMITQVCSIARDRIGSIKVLDNYSFVDLYKTDADNVIQILNGYEYRGRKLNVSYSKKRDDSEVSVSSEETVSEPLV